MYWRMDRSLYGLIVGVIALVATAAGTQEVAEADRTFDRPSIWDFVLGTHAADIDPTGYMDFACGSNGGPPMLFLGGFGDFLKCAPEPSGLREVYFRYDDENEYWARAYGLLTQIEIFQGTTTHGHPVIISLLFNEAGILHGTRLVSDPAADNILRENAHDLRNFLLVRFDPLNWSCDELDVDARMLPMLDLLIHQRCTKTQDGLRRLEIITRHFRKPGQFYRDPATNVITEGQFESGVHVEIFRDVDVEAPSDIPRRAATENIDLAALRLPGFIGTIPPAEAAFLRGETLECPGCNLSGAVLKRLNLSGANLAGAILIDTNFHDATLVEANFAGANLTGANLNRADVRKSNFHGANLSEAMGFQSHFEGADLSDAILDEIRFERASMIGANLTGAHMVSVDLFQARLTAADLTGAFLERVFLAEARMSGAILRGADVENSSFVAANLINADLEGARLVFTDFQATEFNNANLKNVDLSRSRLTSANVTGANMEGAILVDTIMMDGVVHAP
ncbi:MAG: pentapeptide repeat-containing protein [Alphaproteobacteria bacterium]|jgi:uncharacterized protein YjbI with pentapeptide repeats|nr:pentapeptide repeat-containing protein [Alphaproteobacteria bacterium]